MTDGPFKNAELSSRWKQYGKDLVSDAASPDERAAQACHSVLGDVDMNTLGLLVRALEAHAHQAQVNLVSRSNNSYNLTGFPIRERSDATVGGDQADG